MCRRSRLTASPPFCPACRASARENSWAVPYLWAARPPSAAISFWRWSVIPAKPRPLPDARRRLVEDFRARVPDVVERDFVAPDFAAPHFAPCALLQLALVDDFFEPDRWVFVSPFSRRILF